MIVLVIGIGLIGGSISIALKKNGIADKVIGVDINSKNSQLAVDKKIIDMATTNVLASIDEADVIIIAIPVDATIIITETILNYIEKKNYLDKVVFDVGSTKQQLCETIENHRFRKQFVAVHPIAGTENSGPQSAFLELMFDKVVIICNKEQSSEYAINKVEQILKSMFMNIHYMDAQEHDNHIAYVSHLSHLSSFALGLTVLEEEKNKENIFLMAGSGFESTVRLAKSPSSMWEPIFSQNKLSILKALDTYILNLKQYRNEIKEGNHERVIDMMCRANEVRKVLDNNYNNVGDK